MRLACPSVNLSTPKAFGIAPNTKCALSRGTAVSPPCFGECNLPLITDDLRRSVAQLNLCADFLNLRRLLFDGCGETCNFFLQLRNDSSLLLHRAMFFEKLIEQHCVHSFVANRAKLALGVMGHQIGIHLRYLFRYEAELGDAQLVQLGLVMEGDGAQSQDRLTASGHISDVGLEPARGEKHAQLAVIVHVTGASTRPYRLTRNAAKVSRDGSIVSDANRVAFTGDAHIADINVELSRREVEPCVVTDGDVVVAGSVST